MSVLENTHRRKRPIPHATSPTGQLAMADMYEAIDDLVIWGLRVPYWRRILAPLRSSAPLMEHIRERWQVLHGHSSPKGQLPVSCGGSILNRTTAQHLAIAYSLVCYYSTGALNAMRPPAIHDWHALWRGYSQYLSGLGTRQPAVGIETLYQGVIDAHAACGARTSGEAIYRAHIIEPRHCPNHRCGQNHLIFLYEPTHDRLHVCPFCECDPCVVSPARQINNAH